MTGFQSFFIGGFECADHINRAGERVNLLLETLHSEKVFEDYSLMIDAGITTVREGICWSAVEVSPYVYDFSEVNKRIEAAAYYGIQQIWDLCHFGYPDGLIPTHPHFTDRFVSLCRAFAVFYQQTTSRLLYVVPINEISFLSWHSGEVRGTVPFAINCGFDIKYHLCKAAIKGIEALLDVYPDCRILTVEPLIKIHAGENSYDDERVAQLNVEQFQAMDIIGGYICPELGGRPEYLDILGFNYYYNNQWIHNGPTLHWPSENIKMTPLSELLKGAYQRYSKPIVLTETGHFGEQRTLWLQQVTRQCRIALSNGVDLHGICIYPLIDRPDWDNLTSYSRCGVWDFDESKKRIKHEPSWEMLRNCITEATVFTSPVPNQNQYAEAEA